MTKNKEIKNSAHILKMPLILIIIVILTILIIIVSYSLNKIGKISKSPAESFCTNREKTAIVCTNDTVCQCEGKVFDNPFFFANENEKCPAGCSTIMPASSEGKMGSCNLAALMASDVPLCYEGCTSSAVTKKAQKINNDCCTVTMEGPCAPALK